MTDRGQKGRIHLRGEAEAFPFRHVKPLLPPVLFLQMLTDDDDNHQRDDDHENKYCDKHFHLFPCPFDPASFLASSPWARPPLGM